jgi:glycosyltransferase involved in cell wall biosynthesis
MTRAVDVLLVGPLPPPAGGMANQTRQLARLLSGEGLSVRIVQTNAPYRPAWIASLRGARAVFRLFPYLWNLWREAAHARVVHVMANSGLAWFLFASPAIRVARLRRRPVIVNYRGGLAREFLARSSAQVRATLADVQLTVVPSRFLQETFEANGVTAEVIPNVVDVDLFRPSARARSVEGPHVLIARNLEHIYGIDVALRALAIVAARWPQLRVSIAGSGPERAALEALGDELGMRGRMTFTGRLEPAEMADLYRSADLVLNPSRADNMPNSILEALACGVPVVTTDVGGVPYMVEHGRTAWLVPPEAPEAMAEGVAHVLCDRESREGLVRAGLDLARACGWPAVRARWLDAYARAADAAGKTA